MTNELTENEFIAENLNLAKLGKDDLAYHNRNLKLHMPNEERNEGKSNVSQLSMTNEASNGKDHVLSPNSIWSRTRESNLDVSTASSKESNGSPFHFNNLLQEIEDIPSIDRLTSCRDEFMSHSEESSFHSVASSIQSSILTAEEGSNWIYLLGNIPTDVDRQVYELIKTINVDAYPSIKTWKILMETYTEEKREQWTSYEKQIKNITSDLIISHSNSSNNVRSKLLFDD